jgi:uncharacterized protein (TIGR02145 family)
MKKIVTILVLSYTLLTTAQAPQGFNYQATVRNSAGVLIANQNVFFKFNLLLNSQTSLPVYSETHYVPTDDLGQVNLNIGSGTPTFGSFTAINWGTGNYYLGIELNTGAGYVAMGTTQLLSVPYALYANSAGNSNTILPNGTNVGDILNNVWNGNAWVPTASISTAQLPIISTTVATNITVIDANSGGTITSDGGFSITSKGVCWSTSPNPTITNSSTINGTGASSFTSVLSSLLASTNYYYRAYATNSRGTGYGITYTFTTPVIATITTTETIQINTNFAESGGNITSNGGAEVTARGVCWSTSPNPTIALTTKTVNGSGSGIFNSFLTQLTLATTYYVRAYATNAAGTAYGTELSFTTGNIPTITIGSQYWQDTNLDVTTYRDGTPIPQVTDPNAWTSSTTGAWCYYNNSTANSAIYGKLYNWYAVAGIHDNDPNTPNKILAPSGYHVPTDAEWTTLTTFLGGEAIAGGKMKATGTSLWTSPNTGATNSSAFAGLPGGLRFADGSFGAIGGVGSWWSSTANGTAYAWLCGLTSSSGGADRINDQKGRFFSVRCLRD